MKPVGNPKHLVIGTKIDLKARTGDQRRADVRLLAQKPMTVLRDRQEAVKTAMKKVETAFIEAHAKCNLEEKNEQLRQIENLREQGRDLGNAIGLKVITTKGFNPKRK